MTLVVFLFSIWISPPLIELQVIPGNRGDTTLWAFSQQQGVRLRVQCLPMAQDSATGDLFGDLHTQIPSAVPFLRVAPETLTIKNTDPWVPISLTYAIPETTKAGGRYAMLEVIQTQPSKSRKDLGIELSIEVPIWITIQGPGLEPGWAEVTSFRWKTSTETLHLWLRIANRGNLHTWVQGQIRFMSGPNAGAQSQRLGLLWVFPEAPRILSLGIPIGHRNGPFEIELQDPHGIVFRRALDSTSAPPDSSNE